MYLELKRAIINWLLDNAKEWQRVKACHTAFRNYIYGYNGEYLIGGEEVSNFICKADELLFGGK